MAMDLPISSYSKPGLSLSNLIRGDVPGAMQAILDTEGLSPSQMEHFRKMMTGGKDPKNPILKTAWELATNPVMWIGLAMALHPVYGKVGSAKQIQALFSEGNRFIKDVPLLGRYLFSPQTGYRALHPTGFWQYLNKYMGHTMQYTKDFSDKYSEIMTWYTQVAGQKLTRRHRVLISAALDGFGDPQQSQRLFRFGGIPRADVLGGRPLIEGIEEKLRAEGRHLPELYTRLRGLYKEMGTTLFEGVSTKEAARGIQNDLFAKGVSMVEHYFPHLVTRTSPEAWISGLGGLSQKQYRQVIHRMSMSATGPFLKVRHDMALPMQSDLEVIKDLLSPGMFERFQRLEASHIKKATTMLQGLLSSGKWADARMVEAGVKSLDPRILRRLENIGGADAFIERLTMELGAMARSSNPAAMEQLVNSMGRILGAPARYGLDFQAITPKYISGTATTYGWITKGLGKTLDGIIETIPATLRTEAGRMGSLNWIRDDWQTELAPMLRGFKPPREWGRHRVWMDMNDRFMSWLAQDGKFQKAVPDKMRNWLMEGLSGARTGFSEKSLGGRIASLYYASTLGLNLSPAAKNLMQPWITTVNITGPVPMGQAIQTVSKKMNVFMQNVTKLGVDKAFEKAFPEYVKEFGSEGIASAMAAGDITMEGMGASIAKATASTYSKITKGMMLPFAGSEKINRIWSFYAFHNQALNQKMGEAAGEYARNMTQFTQMPGGVLGQSKLTRGMWTPFRQYSHFPLRYMEYLMGSTRMGPDPNVLSTGILGRTLMTSAAVWTGGKNLLGMDLSPGLMMEAVPGPSFKGTPFYPMPFVPPFIGTLGAVGAAALGGDTGYLKDVAKMHVPGGLGLSRSYRALSPKYADYKNRTADGRIPLYNEQGMLTSSVTPLQLTMRALGLQETDQVAEKQLTQYLLRHREEIRDWRRRYLDAVVSNNLEKAERINKQFQRKYPQLEPLKVRKVDIKAVMDRRTQSRIERIMRGFRAEDRPLFQSMLDQSVVGHMSQRLDEDPSARALLEAQYMD